MMASLGVRGPGELGPHLLRRNVSAKETRSYAELFEWLRPGELVAEAPQTWAQDWQAASAHSFAP